LSKEDVQRAGFRQPELVSGSHNDWVTTR